jgi:micrococcal nuclease
MNQEWVLHKQVTLRYEGVERDAYGRRLAFVFFQDGTCVNARMIEVGCALVYRTSEGFSLFKDFLACQQEAIRNRVGMWGACTVKPASSYVGNGRSFVFHRSGCRYGKSIAVGNRKGFQTRRMALEEGYHPCRRCKP